MEFIITIHDKNETLFTGEPVSSYITRKANSTTFFSATTSFGTITSNKTEGDGFTVWTSDYFFKEDVILKVVSSKPVLFFHLILGNSVRISIGEKEYLLRDGQFNLSSFPHFEMLAKTGKGKNVQTFHIHLEPEFLKTFLNGAKELEEFLYEVDQGKPCRISNERHFATYGMKALTSSIIKNSFPGKTGKLFTTGHVNVLVLQGLQKIREDMKEQGRDPLSPPDLEKVILAAEYLANNLAERVPVRRLTRVAGMNEYQLKKGFKQLLGNTIAKHHANLRLEEAMRLLTETKMPVSDIAYSTGYPTASHFSHSFKKKFGFSPSYFRKP